MELNRKFVWCASVAASITMGTGLLHHAIPSSQSFSGRVIFPIIWGALFFVSFVLFFGSKHTITRVLVSGATLGYISGVNGLLFLSWGDGSLSTSFKQGWIAGYFMTPALLLLPVLGALMGLGSALINAFIARMYLR